MPEAPQKNSNLIILLYIKTKSYEEFYISEQQLTC